MIYLEDRLDEEDPSEEGDRRNTATLLRVIAVVPALLLVFIAGRAWLSDDNPVHADGEGVLSASSSLGSFVFDRPKDAREFWGTWSLGVLCINDADQIKITGFRYESTMKPKALFLGVRTLDPRDVTRTPSRLRDRLSTVGAITGRPLQFESGRRSYAVPGSFDRGIDGVEVTTDCGDRGAFGTRAMEQPMQELLLSAQTGPRGAYVTGVEIDYEDEGESRTLRLEWDLGLCGSRVTVCNSP